MSYQTLAQSMAAEEEATQGGPGTGPTTMMISGVPVAFPCKAYPSQMAMMSKIIQGLKTKRNCLLESPTGSGKTLALLCAALAWQNYEAERVEMYNADIDDRHEAAMAQVRLEQKKKLAQAAQSQKRVSEPVKKEEDQDASKIVGNTDTADSSFDVSSLGASSIPTYEISDDEDDFKPTKRSRMSEASSVLDSSCYTSDSDSEALKGSAKVEKKSEETRPNEDSPYFVPAEKKLTVPKIFFGTRTHKQIAQITRELRKTGYGNVRSIVLASREHTCINPLVEKQSNKNEACRELLQDSSGGGCAWHAGARKLSSFNALSYVGISPGYDLEDLVAAGRRQKACPYYTTRFLMPSADIIFCPYNYIIDPDIRRMMALELKGHVVIFDEAHNMEDAARESTSFTLKQDEMQRAMQDCEKMSNCGAERAAHAQLASFLSQISRWMDSQEPLLRPKSFNSYGHCWTGTDFLGSVYASSLTEENVTLYFTYFEAIMAQREKQMEAVKERGTRWKDEEPVIAAMTVSVIEKAFRLFTELTRDNGRHRDDFRVAMSKDIVRQRANGNHGPFRSVQVLSVHLWCLNPSIAFEYLRDTVHSIVLTSGTLSPMQSFESELGTSFPLKLEASHVIDKCQVWASVVGVGPTGVNLNGSYQNVESLPYQDEIGMIVLRICESMPHGVLCFFPSYRMLENMYNRWMATGTFARINAIKTVSMEPRSGPDSFQEAMNQFYAAIKESTRNPKGSQVTGALFMAVCRGKVSEGLDFADNNARAVICVGIPFPNYKDMQVELKREYNNKNISRGLLSGAEWYEIQAFRALNQALGRCIRHRRDWGAIFLIDDRYIRTPRFVSSLSKWIRFSVSNFGNWQVTEDSLQRFRDQMQDWYAFQPGDENTFVESQQNTFVENRQTTSVEIQQMSLAISSQGGAEGRSEYWFGTNKDDNNSNARGLSERGTTTAVVPFANSFSDSGTSRSDFADSLCVPEEVGVPDSFPSPSSSKNEKLQSSAFKLPSTPASIFSKSNKTVKQSNALASLFAKQMEKARNSSGGKEEDKFNVKNVTVANVPENNLSESVNNRLKRPREKKIRL